MLYRARNPLYVSSVVLVSSGHSFAWFSSHQETAIRFQPFILPAVSRCVGVKPPYSEFSSNQSSSPTYLELLAWTSLVPWRYQQPVPAKPDKLPICFSWPQTCMIPTRRKFIPWLFCTSVFNLYICMTIQCKLDTLLWWSGSIERQYWNCDIFWKGKYCESTSNTFYNPLYHTGC